MHWNHVLIHQVHHLTLKTVYFSSFHFIDFVTTVTKFYIWVTILIHCSSKIMSPNGHPSTSPKFSTSKNMYRWTKVQIELDKSCYLTALGIWDFHRLSLPQSLSLSSQVSVWIWRWFECIIFGFTFEGRQNFTVHPTVHSFTIEGLQPYTTLTGPWYDADGGRWLY